MWQLLLEAGMLYMNCSTRTPVCSGPSYTTWITPLGLLSSERHPSTITRAHAVERAFLGSRQRAPARNPTLSEVRSLPSSAERAVPSMLIAGTDLAAGFRPRARVRVYGHVRSARIGL